MSQNTNSDFDKIFLTLKEHFILFSLRIIKRQHGNIYDTTLYPLSQYGLISENYMPNKDSEGSFIPDGTYSLTDKAIRYRIYCRKQLLHRYFTPIIVAFLTTIATNLLKEQWLPALLNYLQGRP
jgi:hypothetical protein